MNVAVTFTDIPLSTRRIPARLSTLARVAGFTCVLGLLLASPVAAQQVPTGLHFLEAAAQDADDSVDSTSSPDQAVVAPVPPSASRLFGVMPNFGTIERSGVIPPQSLATKFRTASLNSFDPAVYGFVGFVSVLHQPAGSGAPGFARQYGRAFADNTIGNFMTSAVLPSLLHQDARYYALGRGHVLRRIAYAASRSVVTRGDGGGRQFNVSELGGNLIAAGVSNAYYSPADRTLGGTLGRWGAQVMWDTLGNEMKEFWPDLRHVLRRR